jgi:predicted signal transduction protein with EAL and GGDEF domain
LRANDKINYSLNRSDLSLHHVVARLGGDEFTIILHNIKKRSAARRVAKPVLQVLNITITVAKREFFIGASIGIAIAAECGENADTAMYEAKLKGKNTYRFFNKKSALKTLKAMGIKDSLRRAINNNELYLAYQPQIYTKTGEMVGCEALIRWHQTDKGWILPDLFIPLAEESGQIMSIGRWVFQEACRHIKQWLQMGYPTVPVWLNISCVQLERENMEKIILTSLAENGLPPESLGIEITESSIMQGQNSIKQLQKLQPKGIRTARITP